MYDALSKSVQKTPAQHHFLSLMQHLLAIRNPPEIRAQYYHLIDNIVTQIVFDGRGIDPDFTGKYKVKVEDIVKDLVDKEKVNFFY